MSGLSQWKESPKQVCLQSSSKTTNCLSGSLITAHKEGEKMNTKNQELEYTEQPSHAKSLLTGLVVGGLVGAGTMLLLAPQAGARTRAEVREGAINLRDQTSETVKDKVTQVKSKANQIKADVQIKAEDLQHQGQDILVKQLDRVSQAAEAGKKAIQNNRSAS
jgi:gas vesicle protein